MYCSDEIEVVLVDNSGPGPVSAHLDDNDTVKIIITMSCDPQTAAQLEESVKQSLLENVQVKRVKSKKTLNTLAVQCFQLRSRDTVHLYCDFPHINSPC